MASFVVLPYLDGRCEHDADPIERRINVDHSHKVFMNSNVMCTNIGLFYKENRRKFETNHFFCVTLYVRATPFLLSHLLPR